MKKLLLITVASLMAFSAWSQEADAEAETDSIPTGPWHSEGNFAFIANQSSYSNWQAGGDNNFSGSINVNYDLNYSKDDWTWDNKFQINYGLTKIKSEKAQKTDDRIEINSLLGKQARGLWYYSGFVNFKSQLANGYDPSDRDVKNSHFFSPAYLQFGPGMLWKKSDNFKVNIAPATARFIFVHGHFTENGESFGVEQGETSRFEFGASLSALYKFDIMENVSAENKLNLYSNYLEKPENVDIDYELNVVMQINRFLSTNIAFQTIYDDNAYKGFQIRQMVGLGLNYKF